MTIHFGSFSVGAQPAFTVTIRDDLGFTADSGTITWETRSADGVEESYTFGVDSEVSRVSVGVYRFQHPRLRAADANTTRRVRASSSGVVVTATEATFTVAPSAFVAELL
jgi:hypothetical protein